MLRPTLLLCLLFLGACTTEPVEPRPRIRMGAPVPAGHVFVTITDTNGTPLPNASAWWLPDGAMQNRDWALGVAASYWLHPYELLRQQGHTVRSDELGRVVVPHRSWLAARVGERTGVLAKAEPGSATSLAVDDWRWHVRMVDEHEVPVADAQIFVSVDRSLNESGVSLGMTDATGNLVVYAPSALGYALPGPAASNLPLDQRRDVPAKVLLYSPWPFVSCETTVPVWWHRACDVRMTAKGVRRIEVVPPADCWPRNFVIYPRHGDPMEVVDIGAHSVIHAFATDVVPPDDERPTLFGANWVWPRCRLGPPDARGVHRVVLPMPEEVAVIRARLLAADGAPCDRTLFQVARIEEQMLSRAWSDPAGGIVLWLNTNHPLPPALKLEVASSVAPERIGQRLTLTLPELTAGKRCDLGTLQLSRP